MIAEIARRHREAERLEVWFLELGGAEFIPFARVAELDTERAPYLLGTRVTYLTMNVRPELSDATPNPLSDVKVRQALNYAIDKDAIIQDRPWQYSGTSGAPRKPSPQA